MGGKIWKPKEGPIIDKPDPVPTLREKIRANRSLGSRLGIGIRGRLDAIADNFGIEDPSKNSGGAGSKRWAEEQKKAKAVVNGLNVIDPKNIVLDKRVKKGELQDEEDERGQW